MLNLNFNNIRSLNGSVNEGFEEFVCQLARREKTQYSKRFVRIGKPDGGVECYWILEDGSIVAWQAKYFCKAFEDSQYQQIDNSVKEALKSHPKLRRYIIAVPTDPSDAHVTGRMSMKDRIDGYIERWEKINADVTFEFWWASDLIEKLQNPSNQGLLRFWFEKQEFTDEDFMQFNADSIKDLGKRYTPNLNVKVEPVQYFEVLSRGNSLRHLLYMELEKVEQACLEISQNRHCHNASDLIVNVQIIIKQIKETNVTGIDRIALDVLLKTLIPLVDAVQDISSKIVEEKGATKEQIRISNAIYDLGVKILQVYNDLNLNMWRLMNDPILILEGEAGVGKSHLIADVVQRRGKEKLLSLFFLGQKFISDEEPLTQMMSMLHFSGSSQEFLDLLEAKAETTGHRIIIFIDAINEGHGLTIWQNNIHSFIERIRQHPWIGLVLSIRTSYLPAILPREEFGDDYCVGVTHHGFGASTKNAVKMYFKDYEILYPSVPLLNPEFRNPLFLHLFCEGMKNNNYRKIPDGIKGITSVMNLFFSGIEKSIRKGRYCPLSIKIVEKAVLTFIAHLFETRRHEMPIDTAGTIFSNIYPRLFVEGELLDCLISEGVFTKNVFYNNKGNYEECIYFTYERFENILLAEYLIDKFQNDNRALEEYVLTTESTYMNGGLLESLAILLPERKGIELYDALPKLYRNNAVINAVLLSLVWRDEKTIDSHLDAYFSKFFEENQFKDRLVQTIMEIAFNTGNYYNADYLHKMLEPMQLADRDAVWIPTLCRIYGKGNNNIIEETINWVWEESNEVEMDDKTVELGATLLSWFLASTNRKLRDTATKGLVQLLQNRILVLIQILEKFSTVDDPYIYERLYGVALGCAVRSKSKNNLVSLCQYIYSSVFNVKGEVYPHILLRDYAREIIEYAISLGEKLSIDVNKIRPPYNSSFDYEPVLDEEIKTIFDECAGYKNSPGMYNMLTSMFTEHTNIGFSYGDFGRYTFQSALNNWKVDAEYLSNVAIKLIIDKYGYREDKHGTFDQNIGSGRGRWTIPNERIGKKYQWLTLHELLARVADNFPKLKGSWSDDIIEYQGPWEPLIRDIDPTSLVRADEKSKELSRSKDFWWNAIKYDNWKHEMSDWLSIEDDIPSAMPIIELTDPTGCDWLALECYPEWNEPHLKDSIYKRLWYQVRSCIIDEEDFSLVYEWAKKQNYGGRWMPECSNRYELFYREFYWSPAYNDYEAEGLTKREIYDIETNLRIAHVDVTTIGYVWEAEEDLSKETSIYCLMPSKQLFDGLKLQYADKEGVFLNANSTIICFDAGAVEKTQNYLLVRKDALLHYLSTHHKKIMWYVLGEKNIIGLHSYNIRKDFPMWLEISGTYMLDKNGNIAGNMQTSHEK